MFLSQEIATKINCHNLRDRKELTIPETPPSSKGLLPSLSTTTTATPVIINYNKNKRKSPWKIFSHSIGHGIQFTSKKNMIKRERVKRRGQGQWKRRYIFY
jgi:hypothetical protein